MKMKQQRLGDVLKLRAREKWAAFEALAAGRDVCLAPISMKTKHDAVDIDNLSKLITSEQKKANYDHVLSLIKCIRWYLLENEAAFRALAKGKLMNAVLAVISALREKEATPAVQGKTSRLQSLLVSISDMFEWEFFGDGHYSELVEQVLLVLTTCDNYAGSLSADAATVLMAMCSAKVSVVIDCLTSSRMCFDMLKGVVHGLPRGKSFYFQALVLEVVYRMYRHSKKSYNEKTSRAIDELISALPNDIAQAVSSIHPKTFRDDTRTLLNSFNKRVGVIKSYRLSKFRCLGAGLSNSKLAIEPTGWLDVGGTMLEIEAKVNFGNQTVDSTIKIPFDSISDAKIQRASGEVLLLSLNDAIYLDELIEGISDRKLSTAKSLQVHICISENATDQVLETINNRLHVKAPTSVVEIVALLDPVETAGIPALNKNDPASIDEKSQTPKCAGNVESAQFPRKRSRDGGELGYGRGVLLSSRAFAHDTSITPQVKQPQAVETTQAIALVTHRTPELAFEKIDPVLSCSSPTRQHSETNVILDENAVGRDRGTQDDDATQDDPVAQRHAFRAFQSNQMSQLRALVEDIMESNAQYQHFQAVQLCGNTSAGIGMRLLQKRQDEETNQPFEGLLSSLTTNTNLRTEKTIHRVGLQRAASSGVLNVSRPTAQISASSDKVLKNFYDGSMNELHKALHRVEKKLRTQSTQTIAQAKQKLLEIEDTFNTEDLHTVQKMLQRV